MKSLGTKLHLATTKIMSVVTAISAVLLASSALAYVFNCFMRYVVKKPFAWPEEYCTYIIVVMVYFIASRMEYHDDMLVIGLIDVWSEKSKILKAVLYLVQAVVTFGVYGILFNAATKVIAQQFKYSTISPIMHIPMGAYFTAIRIFFALIIIAWVIKLITMFRDEKEV